VKRQLRKRQREGEESDSEEEVMPDRQAQERELGQWVGENGSKNMENDGVTPIINPFPWDILPNIKPITIFNWLDMIGL
jgi:hypothetical protein